MTNGKSLQNLVRQLYFLTQVSGLRFWFLGF